MIADEVVAESKGESSTIKSKTTTGNKKQTKPSKETATISSNAVTGRSSATRYSTGKTITELEKELEDSEKQYQDYKEYAVPDNEKVMGAQKGTGTPSVIDTRAAESVSEAATVHSGLTHSASSILGADGTFLPGRTVGGFTNIGTFRTKVTAIPKGKKGTKLE